MITSKTQKLFVILVVLLLLGLVGYITFTGEKDASSKETEVVGTEIVGQDILALVSKLESISIDQSIFSSTEFVNLKDFSQAIVSEAKGRPNPFAIIGSDIYSSVSTTTSR